MSTNIIIDIDDEGGPTRLLTELSLQYYYSLEHLNQTLCYQ